MGRKRKYYDDDDDRDYKQLDPYEAWGMEKPEPEDDTDSDFGNWGND